MSKNDIFDAYETDTKAEAEGVEVRADLFPDAVFRVARASTSNQPFIKEAERRLKPHKAQIARGSMDAAESIVLNRELFIDTLLKGWTGINVKKRDPATGKVVLDDAFEPVFEPLPFTRENAVKLFTQLPDLSLELQRKANDMATFQREAQDADAKN